VFVKACFYEICPFAEHYESVMFTVQAPGPIVENNIRKYFTNVLNKLVFVPCKPLQPSLSLTSKH